MAAEAKKSLTIVEPSGMVKVGTRSVAVRGWRMADALTHLTNDHQGLEKRWERVQERYGITERPGEIHERDPRWCRLACMAAAMFQRNSPSNRLGVRRRTSKLFYWLLERDKLLLIAYEAGGHGRITALKLFNPRVASDQAFLDVRFEKMQRRLDLAEEHVEAVARLRDGVRRT